MYCETVLLGLGDQNTATGGWLDMSWSSLEGDWSLSGTLGPPASGDMQVRLG